MPAKKVNTTNDVIWGNKSVESNARQLPPSRGPATTDPEWNELVDTVQDPTLGHAHSGAANDGRKIAPSSLNPPAATNPHDVGGTQHNLAQSLLLDDITTPGSSLGWQSLGVGLRIDSGNNKLDFEDFSGFGGIENIVLAPTTFSFVNVGVIDYDSVSDHVRQGSIQLNAMLKLMSQLDMTATKVFGWHEMAGAVQSFGMPAPTRILEGTGAAAASSEITTGSFASIATQYTTGNANGNRAGVESASFDHLELRHLPGFTCKFHLNTITNCRLWLLLTDTDITDALGTAPTAPKLVGIRFDPSVDGSNHPAAVWCNGTTFNSQSLLNVTMSTGTDYRLDILATGTNSVKVAIHGTNLLNIPTTPPLAHAHLS